MLLPILVVLRSRLVNALKNRLRRFLTPRQRRVARGWRSELNLLLELLIKINDFVGIQLRERLFDADFMASFIAKAETSHSLGLRLFEKRLGRVSKEPLHVLLSTMERFNIRRNPRESKGGRTRSKRGLKSSSVFGKMPSSCNITFSSSYQEDER